jgi:hypothetical protein
VSDGEIIAKLYLGREGVWENEVIFYNTSRGSLLLLQESDLRYFKIHNIENHLNIEAMSAAKQTKHSNLYIY